MNIIKYYLKIKMFATLYSFLKTLKYYNLSIPKGLYKAPLTIYGDLKGLIEKFDWCKNNPENSSTT